MGVSLKLVICICKRNLLKLEKWWLSSGKDPGSCGAGSPHEDRLHRQRSGGQSRESASPSSEPLPCPPHLILGWSSLPSTGLLPLLRVHHCFDWRLLTVAPSRARSSLKAEIPSILLYLSLVECLAHNTCSVNYTWLKQGPGPTHSFYRRGD